MIVNSSPTTVCDLPTDATAKSDGVRTRFFSNVVASFLRVAAVSMVALVLPAYLIRHLAVQTYAAWVLIIQLAAYVSYFDLGIQTAVSKFVAEYDARADHEGAGRHASAGLILMTLAATLGVTLTLFLAWRVSTLFASMPANLYHDVRTSVVLVGSSLSFGLVCAVYSAVFLGLQRYWIPTSITILNRALFAVVVIVVVAFHGNLAAMGAAVACVNVFTGLLQVVMWRRKTAHIPVSPRLVQSPILKSVARFCSMQSIWMMAMLCITGLDITIVGHYDYLQTGYYSIATLPTSFVLMIVSTMLGPLMPASSAMSTRRSPAEMGDFLARATRYSTLILLLTGLPLIVVGLPILKIWVGPVYAMHTIRYLRILVFANIIRNLCAPYATMIIATNRQEPATAAAISEAVVNLGSSIFLASRFGAIGVAFGTAIGAFVSVALHFGITMYYTFGTLQISRTQLLLKGILRPAVIAIPALLALFLPEWSTVTMGVLAIVLWGPGTLSLTWYLGLNQSERADLIRVFQSRLILPSLVVRKRAC